MTPKLKNIIFAISILFISILILIPNSLGGPQAHLWLYDINYPTESETGYVTYDSSLILTISNEATQQQLDADNVELIISLPGCIEPNHNITINGTQLDNWEYGIPTAPKKNGVYTMPPSGCFPTFYIRHFLDEPLRMGDTIDVTIEIDGNPPVRFDAWGYKDDLIILIDPFSHKLTYIPEFSTYALPVIAMLGIMFIFYSKKQKK